MYWVCLGTWQIEKACREFFFFQLTKNAAEEWNAAQVIEIKVRANLSLTNLFFCNHIAYLEYFTVDFPGFFRSKRTYLRILLKDNQNWFVSSDLKVLCSISGRLHDAIIEITSSVVRCFPVSLQAVVRR